MIPSPALILDIADLFKKQFGVKHYVVQGTLPYADNNVLGDPYKVNGIADTEIKQDKSEYTPTGSLIREKYLGVDIFLPIRLYEESNIKLLMYLPYCVLRISGKNNYISTPMIDRIGSVKELYNADDYKISIKGFLIGADRKFPESELKLLNDLRLTKTALVIDNAITNIFLSNPALADSEQRRVVITDFDLHEVQGGREHVRPFTMTLESDTIFDLEIK